jgi:aminopeptidase N
VQVASFRLNGDQLELVKNVPVTYAGAKTQVKDMAGSPCPDLVYTNYQNWGFAKVQLDQRSFETARSHLASVSDPLLRTMLWHSLGDAVRDGKLPLNEFATVALNNAPQEKDYTLLGDILGKVTATKDYMDRMGLHGAWATKTRKAFEEMAWNGAVAAKGNDNFQRRWFSAYLTLASSPEALARLAGILDGKTIVEGLNVSQDLRWQIIGHLNRYNYTGSAALVKAEQERDKSDTGESAALAATVIRPDASIKSEWLGTIGDPKTKLPFSKIRTAMFSMYPAEQAALSEQSAAQRMATLPALDKSAGEVFMRSYATSMIPATCTPASVKRLSHAASTMTGLSAGTRRALLDTLDEDQRCVTIKNALTVPKS